MFHYKCTNVFIDINKKQNKYDKEGEEEENLKETVIFIIHKVNQEYSQVFFNIFGIYLIKCTSFNENVAAFE